MSVLVIFLVAEHEHMKGEHWISFNCHTCVFSLQLISCKVTTNRTATRRLPIALGSFAERGSPAMLRTVHLGYSGIFRYLLVYTGVKYEGRMGFPRTGRSALRDIPS